MPSHTFKPVSACSRVIARPGADLPAPFELFPAGSRTDLQGAVVTFDASNGYQYCVSEFDEWPVNFYHPDISLENFRLGDDDSREVQMNFEFPYFGRTYSSVFVGSNGYLTFGQGDDSYSATERSTTRCRASQPCSRTWTRRMTRSRCICGRPARTASFQCSTGR